MLDALWLIPAIPFASFIILAIFGPRMPGRAPGVLGTCAIGASAVISIAITASYLLSRPPGGSYDQVLWTWVSAAGFRSQIGLYLDALSLIMTLVVTFVAFLIHLYSIDFMAGDDGYSRFFAYMNLFVGSMVTLLLADNLLFLFLGWEGVGLCSYLLIGFWYRDPQNGIAGQKAFIVTRVGDTAFTIGLLILFTQLGTLQIQQLMVQAQLQWPVGSGVAIAVAALILGGAIGKSAQLPLQTWLPDAMAGPTPTSALIHAATMVTAGVYLVARTHVLFEIAPPVQFAVAVIGATTLLVSGFSALTQWDIKRVLAYSTISQIGYMFLALGVGAWTAAIFHFMTHAFFKALLFLAAGIVIEALHHEHNIFRMGGLRHELPIAFWTFLIGGSALAGLPLITAGFYSKDLIIWDTLASNKGGMGFWIASLVGVVLTALYIFRLIFIVFYGELRTHVSKRPGTAMAIPVVVLSALSIVGGFVNLPPNLGGFQPFSQLLQTVLPPLLITEGKTGFITEPISAITSALALVVGLYFAFLFYLRRPDYVAAMANTNFGRAMHQLWFSDWGFDWFYDRVFVRPFVWFARFDQHDFVDSIYTGLAKLTSACYHLLSMTEAGRVRWYAAAIVGGTVVYVAIVLLFP